MLSLRLVDRPDTDIAAKNSSTQRWGGGLAWYPRPHLQFKGRFLRYIVNQTIASTNQTDLVLHYCFASDGHPRRKRILWLEICIAADPPSTALGHGLKSAGPMPSRR